MVETDEKWDLQSESLPFPKERSLFRSEFVELPLGTSTLLDSSRLVVFRPSRLVRSALLQLVHSPFDSSLELILSLSFPSSLASPHRSVPTPWTEPISRSSDALRTAADDAWRIWRRSWTLPSSWFPSRRWLPRSRSSWRTFVRWIGCSSQRRSTKEEALRRKHHLRLQRAEHLAVVQREDEGYRILDERVGRARCGSSGQSR